MFPKHFLAFFLLIFFLAACGSDENTTDPTTDPNRVQSAQTALAQTTPTPRPQITNTPLPDIEGELALTTARMANAIEAHDIEAYFALVAQDDPVFLTEHRAWAQNWVDHPLVSFAISLSQITVESPTEALARMSILWKQGEEQEGQAGGGTITARFVKPQGATQWLYAGEAWETVHLYWDGINWTEVWGDDTPLAEGAERLRVQYFRDYGRLSGTEEMTKILLQDLPGVYNVILDEYDYEPTEMLTIKFYDTPANLQLMTGIALPAELILWIRPNESIKITPQPTTELPPSVGDMATAVAEAILTQITVEGNGSIPPWILYGASLVARGKNYETATWVNNQLELAQAMLPKTEDIKPEDSPLLEEPPAVEIGIALIIYFDEVYGKDQRNAWLKAMAGGATFAEATQTVFEQDIATLNEAWLLWLGERVIGREED